MRKLETQETVSLAKKKKSCEGQQKNHLGVSSESQAHGSTKSALRGK